MSERLPKSEAGKDTPPANVGLIELVGKTVGTLRELWRAGQITALQQLIAVRIEEITKHTDHLIQHARTDLLLSGYIEDLVFWCGIGGQWLSCLEILEAVPDAGCRDSMLRLRLYSRLLRGADWRDGVQPHGVGMRRTTTLLQMGSSALGGDIPVAIEHWRRYETLWQRLVRERPFALPLEASFVVAFLRWKGVDLRDVATIDLITIDKSAI